MPSLGRISFPVTLALLLLAFTGGGCATAGESSADRPPHHAGDGYRNLYLPPRETGLFDFLRMKYFGEDDFPDPEAWRGKIPVLAPDLERLHHPGPLPQITWIGHATVLFQYRGISVLTDPIFSERASPVSFAGPRRLTPPALRIEELPPVDFVVISHSHYDHLDLPSVRALGNGPFWLVPLGVGELLREAGIAAERIVELDWWEHRELDGLRVTATPLQHWSARGIWDRNETLWAGWAWSVEDFSVWFAGDTGYHPRLFRELGERCGGFDLALLPIGAYAPRWFMGPVHVDPEEAVQIHRDVAARRSAAIQWGTFVLTAEPVDEPPRRLEAARAAAGLDPDKFRIPMIGETLSFETDGKREGLCVAR